MKCFVKLICLILIWDSVVCRPPGKDLKISKRGIISKSQYSTIVVEKPVPAPNSRSVITSAIAPGSNYQAPSPKENPQIPAAAVSGAPLQSQSYSTSQQTYQAPSATYRAPQITFFPPQIYMTKPRISISHAVFEVNGQPVYQTATFTRRSDDENENHKSKTVKKALRKSMAKLKKKLV